VYQRKRKTKTKSLATVDIELSSFAVLDGNTTQTVPISLEGYNFPSSLLYSVKSLWVNDGSNRSDRTRSLSTVSQMTLTSVSESRPDDTASSSVPDFSEEEDYGDDDENMAISRVTTWMSPHHPDPAREQALVLAAGEKVSVEDVVFMINQLGPKDQDMVLSVLMRHRRYHKEVRKSFDKEIPNDFLYAIMVRYLPCVC
jgi:hypothetical protein